MKATFCGLLIVGGLLWGCDLNVANPNQAFEEQVLTTSDGIKALAIGMQRSYASNNVDAYVRHPAITSRELAANTTFSNLIELEDGLGSLTGANSGVHSIWSNSYRIIGMANDLIANAPEVPLAEGTRSGIVALAHLYKAKCLGFVAQAFAHAPIDVQADGQAPFRPREELFAAAIRSLDRALETATSTPPSDEFNADILGEGFDLINTIRAYRARYHLFTGNYQAALDGRRCRRSSSDIGLYVRRGKRESPVRAGRRGGRLRSARPLWSEQYRKRRCAARLLHRAERADEQPQWLSH